MAPLNLTLYAAGHELATDLGYMGSTHFMTVDWIKTFPAHKYRRPSVRVTATRWVRTTSAETFGLLWICPDSRQSMPPRRTPTSSRKCPGPTRFQRTVALIDCDAENAYVVDLFSDVSGGHLQDWTFHGNGHRFSTEGVDLKDRPTRRNPLYDYSGFTFKPSRRTPRAGAMWGSQRVAQAQYGSQRRAVDGYLGRRDRIPRSRTAHTVTGHVKPFSDYTLLDAPGSEIIVGTGPAQRWLDNRDLGEQMKLVTVPPPEQ